MIQSIEKGRKEDGNRSIADKIIKRLHDLEKTVQSNYGRWAWELLQNAKDSVAELNRRVSIQIIFDNDRIEFLHNGNHFSEKDIRGLINQISSKEVDEGEISTRTGKFGTGFLTTHLLSKVVDIKGIVETEKGELFKFNFLLDRDGKTTATLVPKIENAWIKFHASTENAKINKYNVNEFNTSFLYKLSSDEQKDIAKTGVDEFISLIPYVLTFIPVIEFIEVVDNTRDLHTTFEIQTSTLQQFKLIKKIQNGNSSLIRLLYATDGNVSIAVKARKQDDKYDVLSLKNIPKIFCDFPLIGTENFHFPIVVNSFNFNPQTERDGIWLKGETDSEVLENKNLLKSALALYKTLVSSVANDSYRCLYNLSVTELPTTDERYFDKKWYEDNIQTPLRQFLLDQTIVASKDGEYRKLSSTWFPLKSYSKEIRDKIWQFNADLFPAAVCRSEDLHEWINITWNQIGKLTYDELVQDITKMTTMAKVSESFENDEIKAFKWYNEVCSFIINDELNLPLFEKNAAIPNENGNFMIKSELFINEIKDLQLIQVLQLLGEDWNDILLHHSVGFGSYHQKFKKDIATTINEKLKNIDNTNHDIVKAISILSEWFDNNPVEGKDLFSESYRKRAELFMNTIEDKESLYKVMKSKTDLAKVADAIENNPKLFENIEQAKDILTLMNEFNVKNLTQLRKLLEGGQNVSTPSLLPITEEILVAMGITNVGEWEDAMRDTDLQALFDHRSVPTKEMYVLAHSHIDRARTRVINHLKTLVDDYNLDELDVHTAPTILAGIYKHGRPVKIVFRPAYSKEVIVYYGAEKDTLDYADAELWVDDGAEVWQVSLGHILKKNNIKKFPI